MSDLIIYKAIYGLGDVTNIIRKKINSKNQSLSVRADNKTFTDYWHKVKKTLVVVWGFGYAVQTSVVKENETLKIGRNYFTSTYYPTHQFGKINVISAVYGLAECTQLVQKKVKGHDLTIMANNATFNDSWYKHQKSFVLVYSLGQIDPSNIDEHIHCKVVKERKQVHISHTYHTSLADTMQHFEELYNLGKNETYHDPNGNVTNVLKRKTVTEIAQAGRDFMNVVLAVSDILCIVDEKWLSSSVNEVYGIGKNIEIMDQSQLQPMLLKISRQASEIASSFKAATRWYHQTHILIEKAQSDIRKDDEKAKDNLDEAIKRKKAEIERLNDEIDAAAKKLAIGAGVASVGYSVPVVGWVAAAITQGTLGGVYGKQIVDKKNKKSKAKEEKEEVEAESKSVMKTLAKMNTLCQSLDDMIDFCQGMALYFQIQSYGFDSWAEGHDTSEMKEQWREWNGKDVVNWICNLNKGNFAEYREKLTKEFIQYFDQSKLTLAQVNSITLQISGIPAAAAQKIHDDIRVLTSNGQIKYMYIKQRFEDDSKWMIEQRESIQNVNHIVSTLTSNSIFNQQCLGTQPTTFKSFTFKQFGKSIVVDPTKINIRNYQQEILQLYGGSNGGSWFSCDFLHPIVGLKFGLASSNGQHVLITGYKINSSNNYRNIAIGSGGNCHIRTQTIEFNGYVNKCKIYFGGWMNTIKGIQFFTDRGCNYMVGSTTNYSSHEIVAPSKDAVLTGFKGNRGWFIDKIGCVWKKTN